MTEDKERDGVGSLGDTRSCLLCSQRQTAICAPGGQLRYESLRYCPTDAANSRRGGDVTGVAMVGLAPEFANRQASLPCLLVLAPFAVMDHMTSSFLSLPPVPSPSSCNGDEVFVSDTGKEPRGMYC